MKAHPLLGKIINDIELVGKDARLSEARFMHWRRTLQALPDKSTVLFGQLVTMALRFGKARTTAGQQLLVLSSMKYAVDTFGGAR